MYKLIQGHNITTDQLYDCSWSAVTDNYQASTDEEGIWQHDEPMGYGDTEQEAIDDLIIKLGETE